jgi:hypothetical protein
MELLGIALSIPGTIIASALYRFLLLIVLKRWPWITRPVLAASLAVLAAMMTEWVVLAVRGAVETRLLLGSNYFLEHELVFFLSPPALMNVITLPDPAKWYARWQVALPLCIALTFVLVLLQFAVGEELYGIDGVGGPFVLWAGSLTRLSLTGRQAKLLPVPYFHVVFTGKDRPAT